MNPSGRDCAGCNALQHNRKRPCPESKLTKTEKFFCSQLTFVGNALTIIGCFGLLLALIGAINAELFAVGISSGVRVIGAVAVTGCLLSAIGYGLADYFEK